MKPVSRRVLIKRLRKFGFHGPYSGSGHAYFVKETKRVQIPNPHRGDISVGLLKRILKRAGISKREWESKK